jgi:hypothetical protein
MRHDAARRQALRAFGPVEPTKEACRDARGTARLESTVRDVRYTWRSFRRASLVALTIVTTVGRGPLVAVAFTIFNAFVLRVDEVRNPDELFAIRAQVLLDPNLRGNAGFQRPVEYLARVSSHDRRSSRMNAEKRLSLRMGSSSGSRSNQG